MEESCHFRLNNKKLLLTYPQCNIGYDPQRFGTEFMRINNTLEITYLICCRELHHNESNDEHYHLYFETRDAVKSKNERIFDLKIGANTYHPNIKKVTSTPHKTVNYIMKDGNFWEFHQENRPVCSVYNMTKAEKNIYFRDNDPLDLYESGQLSPIQCANLLKAKKSIQFELNQRKVLTKRDPPIVLWFYGATGTGKTRTAIEIATEANKLYWSNNNDLKWFDGYNGQEYAIIDDFRRNMCTFSFFLKLLDRYNLAVPIKGGFTCWKPKVIIITCPVCARESWQYFDKDGEIQDWDNIDQLLRRITDEIEFK